MLDEGRIAVILDGLDEIPEDLRPAVLRALSQQATFRLVLLTRSARDGRCRGPGCAAGRGGHRTAGHRPGAAAGYLTRTQLRPPAARLARADRPAAPANRAARWRRP